MAAQTQTLELPTDLYDALMRAAQHSGTTPAGWIADRLPEGPDREWTQAELRSEIAQGVEQADRGHLLDGPSVIADLHRLADEVVARG